jgi:hypothetical protein
MVSGPDSPAVPADDSDPAPGPLYLVQSFANTRSADGRLVLTVDPASTVQLASAARASYPNIVAAVAVAVAESAASGTWLCLKFCTAPYCGQAFYDDSDPSASTAAKRCSMHTDARSRSMVWWCVTATW